MKASYIKTTLKNVVTVKKIVTVHDYEFDKNFSFEGESHDFWEMVYVDKGKIMVNCDIGEVQVSSGEVIFFKPNEFHSSRSLDSAPNVLNLSFECKSSAMKSLEGFHEKLNNNLIFFLVSFLKECENAYELPKNVPLTKLVRKKGAKLGSEQLLRTYLEQFLILLMRSMSEKQQFMMFPSKESMQHHLVQDVKKYVVENERKVIRNEDVCKYLGYSKTYVSKIFHEQTGKTLAHYVNEYKIHKAKELLREGVMNVSEVSEYLAFDNPQYFSRVFKKYCGIKPTQFKNSLKR
ncbi:MAG: helix-turn-helix transcriptional regulator [Clostridia bacterium]|nr:helix-turn-helix transcriptional regulator [Clostridia bacterium]